MQPFCSLPLIRIGAAKKIRGVPLTMSANLALAPAVDQIQFVKAKKLRNLDAVEEFFWLLEQTTGVFHAVIAEVNGVTTIGQWKHALYTMQLRYPLLSASIRKIPGKRPFFEKVHGASMPLRVAPLTDSLVLEEEMEKELRQQSFGDGSGPLTRATLFHNRDRSVVMFATHHASLDGKSHLLLVQDLVASVAGEDLTDPLKLQPSLSQLLGLPALAKYGKILEARSVSQEREAGIERPKVSVMRVQLSVEETETLLRRSREEGTTVHAALVAGLTLAGKRYSEKWKTGPVRCLFPIDMRKELNIPDATGLLISFHHGPVPAPDGASFWEIARATREDMLPSLTAEEAQRRLSGLSPLVADEHNPQDMYSNFLQGPLAHELLLTNYAGYQMRTEYGNLQIENAFTGSPAVSDVQKVSVLTVNGRLGMTLVARDAFPTLLKDAREILIRA
jgi:hypothetical protein